jgi:hypothetical protein
MSISKSVFIVTVFISQTLFCAGQPAANSGPAASSASAPATPFTPSTPSDILRRALGEVQQTIAGVKLEKWKRGTVRDEAETNVNAIQRDLQGTLPALIKDADTAPGTLSKVLPVARNVDALYDVMVHVFEAARVSAPGEQIGQLQSAMDDLEKARVTLGLQLQQTAAVQEKQIVDLRTTVQAQAVSLKAASTPPPAPKCPAPPAPAKKRIPAKKSTTTPGTTAKPAAGTPATKPAATSTNPQQ